MAADGELQREFQREITVNGGPCCLPSGPLKLFINGMKREDGIPLTCMPDLSGGQKFSFPTFLIFTEKCS